jgi:hypothetical protein
MTSSAACADCVVASSNAAKSANIFFISDTVYSIALLAGEAFRLLRLKQLLRFCPAGKLSSEARRGIFGTGRVQPEEEQALVSETKTLVSSDPASPPKQLPDLTLGTIFAERYEILAHLGTGGMSTVYKVRDTKDDKVVALKMLLPHLLKEADSLKRFQREATSISALKHENILEVHAYEVSATGLPYIVMEYLEGAPLSAVIEREKWLPYGRAVRIFIQIADGLAHAHAKGVIHRAMCCSPIRLTIPISSASSTSAWRN